MEIIFKDPNIRNLKQVGRYTDPSTQGLNIQVKKSGGKYWSFRYLSEGKRSDIGLGTYPEVGMLVPMPWARAPKAPCVEV